jgi:hypothetical protein
MSSYGLTDAVREADSERKGEREKEKKSRLKRCIVAGVLVKENPSTVVALNLSVRWCIVTSGLTAGYG